MDVRVVRSQMSKSGKSLADDVEEIARTIGERERRRIMWNENNLFRIITLKNNTNKKL